MASAPEARQGLLSEYSPAMPVLAFDHDHDRIGLPESGDFAGTDPCGFSAVTPITPELRGARVLIIVALGSDPRHHYLWEILTVEEVAPAASGGIRVTGPGYMLNPPQRLAGAEFDEFLRERSRLPDLCDIEQLPYSRTLLELASRFRRPGVLDSATRTFCDEICALVPDNPDMFMFRSRVLEARGDVIGSLADLQTAAELFEGLDEEEGEAPRMST